MLDFRGAFKRAQISFARINDPTRGVDANGRARAHHCEHGTHRVAIGFLVSRHQHASSGANVAREFGHGGVGGVGHGGVRDRSVRERSQHGFIPREKPTSRE